MYYYIVKITLNLPHISQIYVTEKYTICTNRWINAQINFIFLVIHIGSFLSFAFFKI